MEGSCLELALEGERLCRAGDCRAGVQYFEAAVQVGTDDLKTLSVIYSQLGNAYFYLQDYSKALEFHRHDLTLTRTMGDKTGQAKASGNLGNTLKALGKYDEAVVCCQHHLELARDLNDKVGEARALYNLGNVYHAKGKHTGRYTHHDPGAFPDAVRDSLQRAADFYEQNLQIVQELCDRSAQGRACGNLGNTHYLLGNFSQAISYHLERLAIAREFGDKSAERRAYSNLGNAHIFLGEFEVAADQYKQTLQIAKQLGDLALEAQACYSLGNTYTLLRDYEAAVEYHVRHLRIAQELKDRVGEGRACWSLGNAHTALGNHEKAVHFAKRHYDISREIGDETGAGTAQMNLADLRTVLGINSSTNVSIDDTDSQSADHYSSSQTSDTESERGRLRRKSMENLELMKMTPDKVAQQSRRPARLQKSVTVAVDENIGARLPHAQNKVISPEGEEENFFDLLTKFQGRRLDDQRSSFRLIENRPVATAAPPSGASNHTNHTTTKAKDEIMDMVAGIQSSRINDQRAAAPTQFPGLNSQDVIGQLLANSNNSNSNVPDDNFFEMLMRCQSSRIDEQRSTIQPQNHVRSAPTVPDEDFFTLIQKVQSSRLEEQRTTLPSGEKTANTDAGTKPAKKK